MPFAAKGVAAAKLVVNVGHAVREETIVVVHVDLIVFSRETCELGTCRTFSKLAREMRATMVWYMMQRDGLAVERRETGESVGHDDSDATCRGSLAPASTARL